jgi:hypothetical protein
MDITALFPLAETACRHLLSEQDRDQFSPTYGCFDRRFWAWKLVDFPEATFQRNVYPLAWYLKNGPNEQMKKVLIGSVTAGLEFAGKIQHKNGSFDQAFPNEFSFGATAFLLHPMLEAFNSIAEFLSEQEQGKSQQVLYRAAGFLSAYNETHGHIANHLAGAVLSLYSAADMFAEPRFASRADLIVEKILSRQSTEGWFVEYEGADPGYQTLCMYYLAQVYRLRPTGRLKHALERSVDFLAHFIHPDGTFGGEYGSRRTAIYYPGGMALLADEFPLAAAMTRFMVRSVAEKETITLSDVDMGNLAPLLSNYALALQAAPVAGGDAVLPCEQETVCRDFPEAGLYVRGTGRYYAIEGVSNGGVLKVFDKKARKPLWNDAGYAGQDSKGQWVTTQMTVLGNHAEVEGDSVILDVPFYFMRRELPTPWRFVLLRVLNLTMMLNVALGNLVKSILANMLIVGKDKTSMRLKRVVRFSDEFVYLTDTIRSKPSIKLNRLSYGMPFVSIHMASAKYFEHGDNASFEGERVSVERLNETHTMEVQVKI